MTMPIDPPEEIVVLDMSTVASNTEPITGPLDPTNSEALWAECEATKIDYEQAGPWHVLVKRHTFGSTDELAYTTTDERLQTVKSEIRDDFTNGLYAPAPSGDLFTARIWKDAS